MVSQQQILVVPMTHLEDVRKNITETLNAATDVDGLTPTDAQSFIENDEDGYTNSVKCVKIYALLISHRCNIYFLNIL